MTSGNGRKRSNWKPGLITWACRESYPARVNTIRAFVERFCKHNLELSLPKARLCETDVDFLGHSIFPRGCATERVESVVLGPHVSPFRVARHTTASSLTICSNTSIRSLPSSTGASKSFTPAVKVIVREILAGLSAAPVLLFPY